MKPSFDIETARRNLDRATEEHARFLSTRLDKAKADFASIAGMIIEKYHPTRIWQWGSLLDPDSFAEYSDIDIGIEGVCEAPRFFALLGDAMKRTEFPLDIVQMEKIEPEFSELIRRKGIIVYERPQSSAGFDR
jgi:predicted nucleotidyltransferase